MRRSARVLTTAVIAAVPLLGCSLLVGTSGLSGGDAADGATQDGQAEDTSRPETSSVDAGGDADGDASAPCIDSPGRFCANFDDTNPLTDWSGTYLSRGTVTFEDSGLSAPNALHAAVTASGDGGSGAALIRDIPNATSFRCELDMKLGTFPTASGTELDVVNVLTSDPDAKALSTHQVYMAVFSGAWSLGEYQQRTPTNIDQTKVVGGSLPVGTWFHVVLEATTTSATLTADGKTATLPITVPATAGRSLEVGIPFASDTTTNADILVDNVDCTTSPN